jgi:serine/threonine protein kinase
MNEESIFAAAIQRTDPQQRAAFLDGACAEDAQLRARVEALLRSHEEGGSFLDQPAAPIPPTVAAAPISEGPGTRLGPYKLLQRIGEGGFGVVYMAEQHKPVRRKVALKIIKPGMDTNEVIARFESERQALALMDHPNIAKVFDAGATDTGRPYFVMELVKGVPLIDFCDENHLTTRQRLELFVQVCWAIQHAHQKGIIHRDLKPSNVMVTIHDNKPVPKVIDFGVSKPISQQLTERTLFTAYGQMVGTPTYMSPEQAQMSGLDVDTRSDIYSLGVMLFELLTGSTPLDAERLRKSGYEEMQRLIREEEAPRPSQRLSTQSGDAIVKIAKCRGADAGQLGKQLRGELDWIVIKALEKDRNRRYETANGFAADVERHLNDEAVHARPPSALYRLQKLLRRNRVAAILTATIFLSLIVTAVGTSVGLVQANRYAAQLQDSKSEIEGNLATITEQKEVIEKTNRGLKQQQTELLLQQAELLVEQRRNGYKRRVQPILKELSSRNLNSEERQSLRRLAVATLGDPTALEPKVELKDFPSPIRHIDLSPNGNWLAICLLSGESYLYEIATERSVPIHAEFKDERRDDYHYAKTEFVNDTEIVVNSVQAGEIQRWELRENDSWELSFQKPLEHSPYHFAVAEDGSRSLWVGGAGVLIVMDRLNSTRVSTKRIVNSRGERVRHTHVDISPNGKTVAAKIKDPGRQKWETSSLQPRRAQANGRVGWRD